MLLTIFYFVYLELLHYVNEQHDRRRQGQKGQKRARDVSVTCLEPSGTFFLFLSPPLLITIIYRQCDDAPAPAPLPTLPPPHPARASTLSVYTPSF